MFLALSRMPADLVSFITAIAACRPWRCLMLIVVIYLLLGMVMDSLAMILLTVPIFWPIVAGLDFGLVPG